MRILVFGAGAIGSVLGGLLAEAGHEITLLGRAWHLDHVRRTGLTVTGLWGEHTIRALSTATQPDDVTRLREFDWVFVCVKAHQTDGAGMVIAGQLGSDALVCAFQNGLGNYEALSRHIPSSRIALGRVIFGAELEPGRVRVTVCADDVLLGAPDERFPRERVSQLAAALHAAGIPSRTCPDILTALWGKVLYNCALNGLATLLEVPYGALLERDLTRGLMRAMVEEAYRVAAAHRVLLEPSTAEAYVELLFGRLIPDTAAHHPSMLQDLRRARPTEVEALNGAIVRLAQQAGLTVPANALVTQLIHAKERFLGIVS